jgi:hypothetical protein
VSREPGVVALRVLALATTAFVVVVLFGAAGARFLALAASAFLAALVLTRLEARTERRRQLDRWAEHADARRRAGGRERQRAARGSAASPLDLPRPRH